MDKTNKFYMPTDKTKRSNDDIRVFKKGNNLLFTILKNLVEINGDVNAFKKKHPKIYNNLVQGIWENTPANENGAFDKLRALFDALETKKISSEEFINSSLVANYIVPLVKGSTSKDDKGWEKYQKKIGSEKLKGETIIDKGLNCFALSENVEIGLDMSKVMGTLIQLDKSGYKVVNCSEEDKKQLLGAAQNQIDLIKASSKFKESYEYKEEEIENEDE